MRDSYANVGEPQTSPQVPVVPAQPAADDGVEKVAVIVTHGMGQQVPFETLELVANAVRDEDLRRNPGTNPQVTTRVVRLGTTGKSDEPQLPRAEIRLTRDDHRPVDVHFYEVYWAPLTEGKVTIRDVIAFLWSAGAQGTWNSMRKKEFERWMFGRFQQFVISRLHLVLAFAMALAVLAALVVFNGVIAAVATSKVLTGGTAGWPAPAQRTALTLDLFLIDAALVLIAIGIFVIPKMYRTSRRRRFAWTLIWIGLVGLPVVAGILMWQVFVPPQQAWWNFPLLQNTIVLIFIWGIAAAITEFIRRVLVESIGDVTAYVNAHVVSKFWELRKSIYETAMKVFGPVYKTGGNKKFLYQRIFILGHSLGSVISYDALNGLFLENELSAPDLGVAERTKLFLTFGSPLDKTAFIFRNHVEPQFEVREAEAAAVQPMIVSYHRRPRRWVNLYSHDDWVSGSLEFYDTNPPPPVPAWPPAVGVPVPVQNLEDTEANAPLRAHIQYWTNRRFRETLYNAITVP
jgi:hypothetical protein